VGKARKTAIWLTTFAFFHFGSRFLHLRASWPSIDIAGESVPNDKTSYMTRKGIEESREALRVEYLKKRGVAAMLSLSPRTIDTMTAAGQLPCVRLSKRCILYPRQGVLDALAARTIGLK
jgi:hypothetical protein